MKVVVIGASSGLGAALTLLHARNGDDVVATGRRVLRLKGALTEKDSVTFLENNLLSNSSAVVLSSACQTAVVVYYCAAVADPAPTAEIMRVNFEAFVELANSLEQSGQTLVAISSLAAVIPFDELPVYCASKAALEAWIASKLTTNNGHYVVVRPGQFRSELFKKHDYLSPEDLPFELASEVIRAAKDRQGLVNLGGIRDYIAARLGPIIGGRRARKIILGF